jgi:hypothetical protein
MTWIIITWFSVRRKIRKVVRAQLLRWSGKMSGRTRTFLREMETLHQTVGSPPAISHELNSMRETGEVSDDYKTILTFETWEWALKERELDGNTEERRGC